jgi:hypothetical protein
MTPGKLTSSGIGLVLALAAAFTPACAPLRLPEKTTGPATSREGVQIAVNRQSCTQNLDPDFPGSDLVEEVVELQVRNQTAADLTVRRDAFRLVAPDGRALRTLTWRASDPLALKSGETRTFELRFMTRGGLECGREMKLEPDSGLRMRDHAVQLGAISFQPSRAL